MLFDPFSHGALNLANRTVMSPMTRSRAVDANPPNALMAGHFLPTPTWLRGCAPMLR